MAGAFIFIIIFWVISFQSSIIKVTCKSCNETKFEEPLLGFDLFCKDNVTTTIHFPSYGDLVVKSICYDTKKIDLLDPESCVHRVFMNLDLSLTPFRYYYVLRNYTYLNCSTILPHPFMEVPCLSGSSYHVYTVDPSILAPDSCKRVKTVPIPFEYSPYLSDNSLGLRLSWDLSESEDREARNHTRDSHTSRNTVIVFSIVVFVMAMMIISKSIKVHGTTRNCHQREGQLLQNLADF